MSEVRLKILPPWSVYIKKMEALFDGDPQIAFNVDWDGRNPSVVLTTNNGDKAAALLVLLPEEKKFGNVTLKIGVDCPHVSNIAFTTAKELFETVFDGNPAFAGVITPGDYWYVDFTYVGFKNCVIQLSCDNLLDPRGLISTLYQDIASEIFEDRSYHTGGGIAFFTDVERGNVGKPLGEWP